MDDQFLSQTVLFQGIAPERIQEILRCMAAEEKNYHKGEVIFHAGDTVQSMGIILSGRVSIESDDIWGNKSILDSIGPGQVFAETYACIPDEPLMVSVVAAEPVRVLFLNISRFLQTCPGNCVHNGVLVRNLLSVTAQKNLTLSRRIFHTSSKSIRGRLLSYLSFQAARHGSCRFSIPFNRQELSDYLGVDRSAMSNELSKMQREGLLTVKKNLFCLRQTNFPEWNKHGEAKSERI